MYCSKCGKQIGDTNAFCTGCGAPVRAKQSAEPYAPKPAVKKKGKRKGLAIGLGVAIPVLVIAALAVWLGPSLFTQKASAVVGASGGTVKSGGLEVIFGSGDVQEDVNVTITSSNPDGDSKPNGLQTALYAIDTDKPCGKPVRVRFKLAEGQQTDGLMLGVGQEVKDADGKTVRVHYHYVDTVLKDGYAEADFTPSEYVVETGPPLRLPQPGVAYAAANNLRVYIGIFQCEAYFKDGGHFRLYYPGSANFAGAESLLTDLESAYQAFLDAGYNYDKRTVWPMEVDVVKMDDLGGYIESGLKNLMGRSPDHGWIEINKTMFVGGYKRSELRPILEHEWFHFVQANYETSGAGSPWFDDATSTYWESKVKGGTPAIVNEYQMMIFDGVFPAEDNAHAGYARQPEIKYLAGRFGEGFMLDAYQNIASGSAPRAAIEAATADPAEWAGDCYESIVSGKAGDLAPFTVYRNIADGDAEYSKIGATMELKNPTQDDIDKAAEDGEPVKLSDGSVEVPALGARLLAVTVDPELEKILTDGMTLRFTTASDADIRLFSVTGSKYSVAKAADYAIEVRSFKADLDSKTVYLLLLTNTDTSAKSVSASAELVMFPTLDELVGKFDDGMMTITDVYISQKLRDEAKATAESASSSSSDDSSSIDVQGCDLKVIEELDKLKGQTQKAPFSIEKTGDDAGNIVVVDENGKRTETPFTYKNGILSFDITVPASKDTGNQEMAYKGEITAAYSKNNDVKIEGPLRYFYPKQPDDFYMEVTITGSHPLPPMKTP